MITKSDFGDKMKRGKLAKIPVWGWWIVLYVLIVGSNYFMTNTTIYQVAIMMGSASVGAEMGNMLWFHFLAGFFGVVLFEIIAMLYSNVVTAMGAMTGGFDFSKKDFIFLFRLFYIPVFVISGALQVLYYYNTISVVFGRLFFVMLPRLIMMIALFFYIKKQYLTTQNTHTFIKAFFLPYIIYEIVSIVGQYLI